MNKLIKDIKQYINADVKNKYFFAATMVLALSLLCELFVFNFKCFSSLTSKPLNITPRASNAAQTMEGLRFTSDNAELLFKDVNSEIKYIYFDPGKGNSATLAVSAKDEANANFISAPDRAVSGDVPSSQYIRLNFSGNISELKIDVRGMNDKEISSGDIVLNTKVPLHFSFVRFAILAVILMLLYLIRPGSELYKYKTDMKSSTQRAVAAILIVVQAVCLMNMVKWNTWMLSASANGTNHQQYYSLIESFKQGKLSIDDDKIDDKLLEMENPYDYGERSAEHVNARWDEAFYNGKYYVYFGVVPALILYLPYNLVTGKNLPHYQAVCWISVALMIGIMYLLWQIIRKKYPNTPFVTYLLLSTVYGAVSGIGYAIYKPDFYIIAPLMAVAFAVFGLAFWLSAEKTVEVKDKKNKVTENKVLVPWRLAAGSSCIALIAGCRPQVLLAAVLGVIIFWNTVFKERRLFSKESIKETLAICIPFVVVAIGVMWYNAARFGSPFDFGATYNLTTNDMTHRGMKAGRIGLGLFSYLFQPISMNGVFPFIHDFDPATAYQGLTLHEKMIGGIYMIFPILLIGLYGAFRRKSFNDKGMHSIVLAAFILTAFLAVFDAQMAGLLTRYFTDFVWLAMLGTCISVFSYYEKYADNAAVRSKLIGVVTALTFITLAFVFLRLFAHSEDAISLQNPTLYHQIEHMIAFWL